jgi:hypothetical protein
LLVAGVLVASSHVEDVASAALRRGMDRGELRECHYEAVIDLWIGFNWHHLLLNKSADESVIPAMVSMLLRGIGWRDDRAASADQALWFRPFYGPALSVPQISRASRVRYLPEALLELRTISTMWLPSGRLPVDHAFTW